jgi:hypothetical protein
MKLGLPTKYILEHREYSWNPHWLTLYHGGFKPHELSLTQNVLNNKLQVLHWCSQNNIKVWISKTWSTIRFDNLKDVTAFMLKWQ